MLNLRRLFIILCGGCGLVAVSWMWNNLIDSHVTATHLVIPFIGMTFFLFVSSLLQ